MLEILYRDLNNIVLWLNINLSTDLDIMLN